MSQLSLPLPLLCSWHPTSTLYYSAHLWWVLHHSQQRSCSGAQRLCQPRRIAVDGCPAAVRRLAVYFEQVPQQRVLLGTQRTIQPAQLGGGGLVRPTHGFTLASLRVRFSCIACSSLLLLLPLRLLCLLALLRPVAGQPMCLIPLGLWGGAWCWVPWACLSYTRILSCRRCCSRRARCRLLWRRGRRGNGGRRGWP